jgi:hypothetical protein
MENLQYMHYRKYIEDDLVDCHGGATLAILSLPDNLVMVAMATCSKREVFSRKRGRDIALGRLTAASSRQVPYVFTVTKTDDETMKSAVHRTIGQDIRKMGYF